MKVTSFILSKQLRESSYPQDNSYFYWAQSMTKESYPKEHWYLIYRENGLNPSAIEKGQLIASPTADEILDKLPVRFEQYDRPKIYKDYQLHIIKRFFEKDWLIKYEAGDSRILQYVYDESLANAAAKMFLFLKQN